MHAHPAALHPDIPALIGLGVVHAGDDGIGAVVGRRPQPERHAKRLVVLEVAGAGDLRSSAVEQRRRCAIRSWLPGRRGREWQVALLADELHEGTRPLPFGERQIDERRVLRERLGHDRHVGLPDPGLELGLGVFLSRIDRGLGDGNLLLEHAKAGPVSRLGHRQDRRCVVDVAVHHVLRGVIEEGRELVELLLRERIKLVVVAHGAAGSEAEPHGRRRLCAVAGVEHGVFLGNHSAFVRRDVAAVEAAGDLVVEDLVGRGIRAVVLHEIAGQLQDRELIERHVAVERVDHPLPIGPHLAEVVEVDAVGVAVACVVEPVAAAMLAPLEAREQRIDEPLVGVGVGVVHESIDEGGLGWQAREVEREPAGEHVPIGLGGRCEALLLEPGEDEAIERVFDPGLVLDGGRRGPPRRDERPVGLVLSAFGDPPLEELLLFGREHLLHARWRHHLLGILGEDAVEGDARIRVAGHDGATFDGGITVVEPEVGLAAS